MGFSEYRRGLRDLDFSLPALNPRALQENRGSPFIYITVFHIQIALYRLQSVLMCIISFKLPGMLRGLKNLPRITLGKC